MDKNFLKALLSTNTPDGKENIEGIKLFDSYCSEFAKKEFTDSIYNSAFSIGTGDVTVMISAHIDEVSMLVQYIDEDGFIYVIPNGFIDVNILPSTKVNIMNDKGNIIEGIIGVSPAHLSKEPQNISFNSIKIDCGFENKDEAIEFVEIGDSVLYSSNYKEIGKNRICGKGLDDKIGIFVVCEALKRLSKYNLNSIKVYGVAMVQEEVGGYGAITVAKRINPNYSIDFDAHFATDDGNVDPKEWGDVKLGKGGAICNSADCNTNLVRKIKDTCRINNIPYQTFSKPIGMTNTLSIRNSSTNAKTVLLSFPLRNMHTPVEICDCRDIESLINMTTETIKLIDNTVSSNKLS